MDSELGVAQVSCCWLSLLMSLPSVPSDPHLSAETGWRVPYLYTARLSASSWAWGSMGALGTGVLVVAEGAEMWTGWALEGGWVVAVICREKKEEGRLDGMRGPSLVCAVPGRKNVGKRAAPMQCVCYSGQ